MEGLLLELPSRRFRSQVPCMQGRPASSRNASSASFAINRSAKPASISSRGIRKGTRIGRRGSAGHGWDKATNRSNRVRQADKPLARMGFLTVPRASLQLAGDASWLSPS